MSAVLDNVTPHSGAAKGKRLDTSVLEPRWVSIVLIAIALVFLTLFLFIPLAAVFTEALKKGWEVYVDAVIDPDAVSAIKLTLIAAVIAIGHRHRPFAVRHRPEQESAPDHHLPDEHRPQLRRSAARDRRPATDRRLYGRDAGQLERWR